MDAINSVFEKIKKAEAILDELDKKRSEGTLQDNGLAKLDKDYLDSISNARHTLASIREKLSKELAVRIADLDKCQEELATLDARLKVGEITEEEHQARGKHLIEKIKLLEQKVSDIQALIAAKFAENIAPVIQSGKALIVAGPLVDVTPAFRNQLESVPEPPEQQAAESTTEASAQESDKTEEAVPETEEKAAAPNEPAAEMKQEEKKEEEKPAVPPGGEKRKAKAAKARRPSLHLHPLKAEMPPRIPMAFTDLIKKNRTLATILAAVILGLLAWGGIVLFMPRPGNGVGNIAPDFVMQLGDNRTSSLAALRGKDVIVVFWDRDFWDGQFFYVNGVQRNLYTPDRLNDLYSKYSDSGLSIIAIASGTNSNEVDSLVHEYGVNFPVIVDSFGKLRASYNVSYEPTFFFLDKNGVIRARVEGPIANLSDFEQMLYNVDKNSSIQQPKPPVSDVLIQSVTEKSAVVNWSTAAPTTTQLDIDGKNILSAITPAPQTIHTLTLRDLSPNTSYRVRILYNVDNINVSEHSFAALADTVVSKPYLVQTLATDLSNPEISSVSTSFITDTSATVIWKTDEPTTGVVNYGTDTNYGESANQIEPPSIWHTVKIDGLLPDTSYFLQLESKDLSGKQTTMPIEPIKTQSAVAVEPTIGNRAPDFTLYSLDGTRYTLSQFFGHPILLNFWLAGCPACEGEMPVIQQAYDKYSRDQLTILAVNVRGDSDKVAYYIAQGKFTFPILMDSEGNVDEIYKAPYFPTSYMIDSKGIIQQIITERFQNIGDIDDALKKLQ